MNERKPKDKKNHLFERFGVMALYAQLSRKRLVAAVCAGVLILSVTACFFVRGHGVKIGDVYCDVHGTKYTVIDMHDTAPDGRKLKKPFVVLKNFITNEVYMPAIEDLGKPQFMKD